MQSRPDSLVRHCATRHPGLVEEAACGRLPLNTATMRYKREATKKRRATLLPAIPVPEPVEQTSETATAQASPVLPTALPQLPLDFSFANLAKTLPNFTLDIPQLATPFLV